MKRTPLLALLLLTLGFPIALAAQQQTALGTKADSWGRVTLLNEVTGENLGSVGLVRGNLNGVVVSAEAARQFRSAQRHRTIGTALIGVGSAVAIGALAHYVAQPDGFGMSTGQTAAFGGGAGIMILGAKRAWSSQRSLQFAIDSYNRTLALCKAADGPVGSC